MSVLRDLEVGAMFWAARDTVQRIKSLGAKCGQLGVAGGEKKRPGGRRLRFGHYPSDRLENVLIESTRRNPAGDILPPLLGDSRPPREDQIPEHT